MAADRPEMDAFLASVEGRAYRMAQMAIGSREDALDIVQDAMFGWVQRYSGKPEAQWRPLFYRILHSRIVDWLRRRRVRNRLIQWWGGAASEPGVGLQGDPVERLPDPSHRDPADRLGEDAAIRRLHAALARLPLRQRQAFLLRAWEGLSVAETGKAMGCSQGSVKTHFFRAVQALRLELEDHLP